LNACGGILIVSWMTASWNICRAQRVVPPHSPGHAPEPGPRPSLCIVGETETAVSRSDQPKMRFSTNSREWDWVASGAFAARALALEQGPRGRMGSLRLIVVMLSDATRRNHVPGPPVHCRPGGHTVKRGQSAAQGAPANTRLRWNDDAARWLLRGRSVGPPARLSVPKVRQPCLRHDVVTPGLRHMSFRTGEGFGRPPLAASEWCSYAFGSHGHTHLDRTMCRIS
jgi:hypothetical protein